MGLGGLLESVGAGEMGGGGGFQGLRVGDCVGKRTPPPQVWRALGADRGCGGRSTRCDGRATPSDHRVPVPLFEALVPLRRRCCGAPQARGTAPGRGLPGGVRAVGPCRGSGGRGPAWGRGFAGPEPGGRASHALRCVARASGAAGEQSADRWDGRPGVPRGAVPRGRGGRDARLRGRGRCGLQQLAPADHAQRGEARHVPPGPPPAPCARAPSLSLSQSLPSHRRSLRRVVALCVVLSLSASRVLHRLPLFRRAPPALLIPPPLGALLHRRVIALCACDLHQRASP